VWCRTHPEKKAAIVIPTGTYIIVFLPNKEGEKLADASWITKEFIGKDDA
jgi:hypothetical protein